MIVYDTHRNADAAKLRWHKAHTGMQKEMSATMTQLSNAHDELARAQAQERVCLSSKSCESVRSL